MEAEREKWKEYWWVDTVKGETIRTETAKKPDHWYDVIGPFKTDIEAKSEYWAWKRNYLLKPRNE